MPFDDLLTQVAQRTAPAQREHQARCPHCQAALAELEALWAPVHRLAAEHVEAPPTLLEQVMRRVRSLPRNTWYAVLPEAGPGASSEDPTAARGLEASEVLDVLPGSGPRGSTRVGARVVGAIARLAAEDVPQVTLALGRGRTGATSTAREIAGAGQAAAIGVAGQHVVVDVHVVVDLGAHLPSVAGRVRAHIARQVAAHTGLTTSQVHVTIVDVQPPAEDRDDRDGPGDPDGPA